jgi:hypothetical protein
MTDEELIARLRSGVQDEDYSFGDDPAIMEAEDIMRDAADRIEQLNEKLAKAVEALDRLVALNDDYSPFAGEFFHDRVERTWRDARTTLAELKGQNDD